MKMLLTAFVLIMAADSRAELISKRFNYIHTTTGEKIEISSIDQDTQVGKYYDHKAEKYKSVNMSDLSQESSNGVNGVKEADMVLAKFGTRLRACEVWNVYENGAAHVGCQTGKINYQLLVPRQEVAMYSVSTNFVVKAAQSFEGYTKKDKVYLMKKVGDLKKGDLVRIEHIFANGLAMVQKMGTNLVDTSGLLMKSHVQIVDLKDLSF